MIAGNWKMNAGGADGCDLATGVARVAAEHDGVDVLVAPPYTALAAVSHALSEDKIDLAVAAQNMHFEEAGAYTGEVSASML
ncbi:MAG: triose-phosphate isomerase, partial [Deltaproteobacteria bacterium]